MKFEYRDVEILLEFGDITKCPEVDAIVNAANERLLPGAGVCGAIFKAAGHQALYEGCMSHPVLDSIAMRCPTGEARVTGAYGLPNRMIVHAVGPIFDPNKLTYQEWQLQGSYTSAMVVANAYSARSIAFPAISCGIYRFPLERAALAAFRGICAGVEATSIQHIRMVFLPILDGPKLYEVFTRIFDAQTKGQDNATDPA